MPDSKDYLNGFGLSIGNKYGSYTLSDIKIEEKSEVVYNRYSYDIDLTLTNLTNPSLEEANLAIRQLFAAVNLIKIIYTPAGRPYQCIFHWPLGVSGQISEENNYTNIHYLTKGYAIRLSKKEVEQISKDGKWILK